jgi:hypothetical protein
MKKRTKFTPPTPLEMAQRSNGLCSFDIYGNRAIPANQGLIDLVNDGTLVLDTDGRYRTSAQIIVKNFHENQIIDFVQISENEFESLNPELVFLSQKYEYQTIASSYYVVKKDNKIGYVRKSDHWGRFGQGNKWTINGKEQHGVAIGIVWLGE